MLPAARNCSAVIAPSLCASMDLFVTGQLAGQGFVRQEEMDLPVFLENRFGKAYGKEE